ncbi:hypothetical protein PT015_14630 [Candidatus Mycobacterium wuenschmannii]|uniref:Uncharacterized protein n=1 Tax=Candidatus Mycobacterium wuenschmannii TaxID=3027808 RepID=A0ABY8VVG7_9MYCO|nr:hypothetical protein [Candidatus Mycobacterium wuenschmannii]WIM86153.1 hypothetical protein PT015_14630 [Candidatus Mycobacterium wuenschmannii]
MLIFTVKLLQRDRDCHPVELPYQGTSIPKRLNKLELGIARIEGSPLTADPEAEDKPLSDAARASERRALAALRDTRIETDIAIETKGLPPR